MPPPPRSSKPGSLTAALDTKILILVRRYIDDAIEDGDTSLFNKSTSSLRLSVSQLSQYVSAVGDGRLQRTKKSMIEKSIERAIEVINYEQEQVQYREKDKPVRRKKRGKSVPVEEEEEARPDEEDEEVMAMDSDFEGIDVDELVEIKDTNAMNKRIVSLWSSAKRVRSDTPPPTAKATTLTATTTAAPTVLTSTATTSTSAKPAQGTETPILSAPTPTNGDAHVPSSKKRKDKPSSTKEGTSSKRQKVAPEKDPRAPPTHVTLADLGGLDDVIHEIFELIVLPLSHPEVYTHTGVPPPRGVLLHGPPGCGKTLTANAIAGELGLPFISVSAPSIVSGMSGESEKKLRDLFDEAREKAPCIMFLDEIDAITPKRESAQREMERRIVAQMLTCMDELTLEKTNGKPVLIIGATNRPDSLDPALRRAGRFDREICLGVPDEVGREKILRVLSKKLRLAGDFDFRKLARMTPGFVGADLTALTAAAGVCAIKRIFNNLPELTTTMGTTALISDSDMEPSVTNGAAATEPEEGTDTTTTAPTAAPVPEEDPDSTMMDLDPPPTILTTSNPSPDLPSHFSSPFYNFLKSHPAPLTPTQLLPLFITLADFFDALPKIQPSSKREGFATVPDTTWSDIGALHPIRHELQMSIVLPIKHPEIFSTVGITAATGVLLWGPPGCGKTLLAKAVANESKANFISVRGPELLNKYVGESERAVRQVFTRARASTPCIIFFDELDALTPTRSGELSDASARVVNTLLTELDGLHDRKGVYVVGATNRPDVIDPAMLRPGRLDKPLLIDLPTPSERAEILKTLVRKNKTPVAPGIDLDVIGNDKRCVGFSGADLAALIREAAVGALTRCLLGNATVNGGGGDENNGDGETDEEGKGRNGELIELGESEESLVKKAVVGIEDFDRAWGKVRPSVSQKEAGQYRILAKSFGSTNGS